MNKLNLIIAIDMANLLRQIWQKIIDLDLFNNNIFLLVLSVVCPYLLLKLIFKIVNVFKKRKQIEKLMNRPTFTFNNIVVIDHWQDTSDSEGDEGYHPFEFYTSSANNHTVLELSIKKMHQRVEISSEKYMEALQYLNQEVNDDMGLFNIETITRTREGDNEHAGLRFRLYSVAERHRRALDAIYADLLSNDFFLNFRYKIEDIMPYALFIKGINVYISIDKKNTFYYPASNDGVIAFPHKFNLKKYNVDELCCEDGVTAIIEKEMGSIGIRVNHVSAIDLVFLKKEFELGFFVRCSYETRSDTIREYNKLAMEYSIAKSLYPKMKEEVVIYFQNHIGRTNYKERVSHE